MPAISDFLTQCLAHPPEVKRQWEDAFEQMIVHTRCAEPEKLLKTQRPNEPKEILDYRLKTHQDITHSSINEAIIRCSKIVNETNHTIEISDVEEEYFQKYYFEEFDAKGTPDLIGFWDLMYGRVFRLMCETGNALIVYLPTDRSSISLPPQNINEQVNIAYLIVEPSQIFYLSNQAVLFQLKNKVEVKVKDTVRYEYAYMYIDKRKYVYLRPFWSGTAESGKIEYAEDLWYSMQITPDSDEDILDILPVVLTKGYATYDDKANLYYESYFSGFVPLANEALLSYSDDKAVRIINNYPLREEKEEECDACHGTGKIDNKKCSPCAGTGFTSLRSPFSVYKKRPPGTTDAGGAEWSKIPALSYIEPPVAALKHSFETWQYFLDAAERKVNVKFVDESQSGASKDRDSESLVDLRLAISANFFDNIVYKSLWIIESLLKPVKSDRQEPVVIKPTAQDLQFKTKDAIIAELASLSDGKIPHFLANMKMLQAVSKLYPDDEEKQAFTKVLMYYDPFFGWSEEQISRQPSTAIIQQAKIKHLYAEPELRKMFIEDEKFFEKDVKVIAEELDKRVQVYLTDPLIAIENIFPNEA